MADPRQQSDLDKLRVLLPYLIDHNREHTEELREWLPRVEAAALGGVVAELTRVISLSEEITARLSAAVEKLGRSPG